MSDLSGKVCVVTGANSGIGKVTARALAERGAQVLMVCRSRERGEKARGEIMRASGSSDVELIVGDLSVQRQVQKVADDIHARVDRLDILVNNAGAIFYERRESADGLEMTFALNHMGYFLLTLLLLDLIKQSAPARIINVSSDAHRTATLDFDDLQNKENYSAFRAYGQSKLANILFTRELARRLEGSGVTVNAVHPGFVNTGFGSGSSGVMAFLFNLLSRFIARTPEKGAETSIYVATAAQGGEVSGRYFADSKLKSPSSRAQNDDDARRLWDASEALSLIPIPVT